MNIDTWPLIRASHTVVIRRRRRHHRHRRCHRHRHHHPYCFSEVAVVLGPDAVPGSVIQCLKQSRGCLQIGGLLKLSGSIIVA